MSIRENIKTLKESLTPEITLVAVSKTKPNENILEAYNSGHRVFGENKVQELVSKQEDLPKDIEWHMIGHLQRNKVKYIAPFVSLIHGVDSLKLLKEINKRAEQNNRTINCLLQVHIAEEDTKFGFSPEEIEDVLKGNDLAQMNNVNIVGLMGMATNTDNQEQVQREFIGLKHLFDDIASKQSSFSTLSMGMSGDYEIALAAGSNMIRVGSRIFGARNYS